MPRRISFNGKVQEFPDSATDEQIAEALGGGKPAAPQMDMSRVPDPDGALALSQVAENNPGAAAAGAAAPLAALAPWGAMLRTGGQAALKAIESPILGGLSGGFEGYKRGGIPGALMGAAAGAGGSGLLKAGQGYLRAATAAKNAEAAAAAAPSLIKVATPGLGQMLARPASGAVVQQAEQAALRNQLLHQLASQKGAISPEAAVLTGGATAGLAYAGKQVMDKLNAKKNELNHTLNPLQKYDDLLAGQK